MPETREEIEKTGRPAVLVRRTDLPVPLAHHARSFLGGLPRLPPELAWPRAEVPSDGDDEDAEEVALTFVAQIDLAELPAGDWSPLPKQGTLFFFCSSLFVGEATPPCTVFYNSAAGDAYPQREPPSDLMRLGG
jgi:uncharacterized protein YwqG